MLTEVTFWLETDQVRDLADAELHGSRLVASRAEFLLFCEQLWSRWERATDQDVS